MSDIKVEKLHNLHVGIDVGHGNVKIAVRKTLKKENGRTTWFFDKFPSYVTLVSSENDYMNFITNDYLYDVITFDGNIKYLYGNPVMRENKVNICQRGKRFFVSDAYKVLIAGALDVVMKHVVGTDSTKVTINSLGLGLPLTYLKMVDVVESIKSYFAKDESDRHVFTYNRNGTDYTIYIKELGLFAQGAGALFTEEIRNQLKKYNTLGIIDIGQYTTDYFIIKDNEILLDSVGTEEHGIYEMINEVRNEIQKERGTLVNEELCRQSLLEEKFRGMRTAKAIVILNAVQGRWVNYLPDIEKFVIIGGGAELIKDLDLSGMLNNMEVLHNAEYLNAKGYTYV
ncbi:hypothetical protein DEFDS_P232 (plasmid) [Deferribacter desulfuricans SSM1]|uniref:Uncharacterized protein n=1 Tax=Deferribacter desulfuricans (strain DSM 14783 / JCM 11476 / NBRC 101012 / SSM1) TaxID=639282 RepID=D3PF60_DEFDS|nr:ParM/StbA family protein [Deferribacter desulfuricans]BAI81852.1 hypothetical protein DEFDS_P232 [Deferribacter desulfuricans SSM1]